MEQLTKQGKDLWDKMHQYDNTGNVIVPKAEAVQANTSFVAIKVDIETLIAAYTSEIHKQNKLIKVFTKKEHYFRANEAKVAAFVYGKIVSDLNRVIAEQDDIIQVDTIAVNQYFFKDEDESI